MISVRSAIWLFILSQARKVSGSSSTGSSNRRLGQIKCTKATKCQRGSSFCNFVYGNQGLCEPCSRDRCLDSRLETAGVLDCFDSCNLIGSSHSEEHHRCHGYIVDQDEFIPNTGPFPISCGSKFGDSIGPTEYQESSCCHGAAGPYFVLSSQQGGFDFSYESPDNFPTCSAYATALTALLCDPRQGKYIRSNAEGGGGDGGGNVLRVCRSSCDAVFDSCGPPGEVFPRHETYTDGPSLCQAVWGGFGGDFPCDSRPEGYPCRVNLSLEIAEDDSDDGCLDMIFPSDDVIEHYKKEWRSPVPDSCKRNSSTTSTTTVLIIVFFALSAVLIIAVIFCIRRINRGPPTDSVAETVSAGKEEHPGDDAVDAKKDHHKEAPPQHNSVPEVVAVMVEIGEDHGLNNNDQQKGDAGPNYCSAVEAVIVEAEHFEHNGTVNNDLREEAVPNSNDTLVVETGKVAPTSADDSHIQPTDHPSEEQLAALPQEAVPSTTTTTSEVSISECLANTDAYNTTNAVAEWIAANRSWAALLTPVDVASVLAKISFSLDHPQIAKLLAQGIQQNGGTVTCWHVVSAMEKSPNQDADIAKAMAPYVSDPENKDEVLQRLRLGFFREEVAKCFVE